MENKQVVSRITDKCNPSEQNSVGLYRYQKSKRVDRDREQFRKKKKPLVHNPFLDIFQGTTTGCRQRRSVPSRQTDDDDGHKTRVATTAFKRATFAGNQQTEAGGGSAERSMAVPKERSITSFEGLPSREELPPTTQQRPTATTTPYYFRAHTSPHHSLFLPQQTY